MAKLYFRYGAMNCGKTTALIQVAHNYEERGMHVLLLKPSIDKKGADTVISRMGTKRQVDILVDPTMDLGAAVIQWHKDVEAVHCVLVDEAQFLTPDQVTQLFKLAVEDTIPVLCYGLRTDFLTNAFPGSARLFELAHSLEELKTICRCGKKALFNGRKINDLFVFEGSQVAIDGLGEVTYESLCGACYLRFQSAAESTR